MKRIDGIRRGKATYIAGAAVVFLFVLLNGYTVACEGDESLSWKRSVEMRVGYGVNIFNTKTDIQNLAIFPAIRWRFLQKHYDNGAILNFSAMAEGALLQFFKPEGAVGLGLTPWLRLDVEYKSLIYYFQAGSGGIWTNLDVHELGQEVNFTPQGEFGLEIACSKSLHVNLAVRYFHMSNAGLNDNNQGINEAMGLVGISLPF